jgi:hypothetical protein
MSVQQFWKGLAMLLVSIALTAFQQVPLDYALLFVGGVSALFGYIGKNLIFVIASTSVWAKIGSGLLVAIGSGISESIGLIVVEHKMVWVVFFKVVGSIFLTYIATSLMSPPAAQSKQLKKFTLFKQAA